MQQNDDFYNMYYSALIGCKIVGTKSVRFYDQTFPALIVRDHLGSVKYQLIISRDDEMNGPGRLIILEDDDV